MDKKQTKIYLISGKARHGKDTTALIIDEFFENKGLKVINLQLGSYIKEYAKKISDWDGSEETKPRELLQNLGTTVIRGNIDKYFFIKRMIEDLKVYNYFFDVVTISDVRLKDEIEMIKKEFNDAVSIHIVRPNFDNGLTLKQKNHPTEIDLDDYKNFDYTFINDGTISDLKQKITSSLGD